MAKAMVHSLHGHADEVVTLKIQIFHFEDCPNFQPATRRVQRAVLELGVDADIELVRVDTPELAASHRFLGSPTIQVDGVDIDPSAHDREDFGLSCRRYGSSGVPSRAMIVSALREGNGGSE